MKLTVTLTAKGREIYLDNQWYKIGVPVEMELASILRHRRSIGIAFPDVERPAYDKTLWKRDKIFGLTGDADTQSGFGNCTVNLITYSDKEGYDVRWIGKNNNVPEIRRFASKELPQEMAMVWHEQPREEWNKSPFAKNMALVPFETTRIPQSWVPKINRFDALLVPCEQNVIMMRDSGVKIPISVIRWGVDLKKFKPVERHNQHFTFGTMGALSERKGTDVLVKAFELAFPRYQYPNVRLICKSSHNMFKWGVKDDRITINLNAINHEDLINTFVNKIDCFVFPSRGEGAGLPPMEMMATGLPVIGSNWSGMADYMGEEYSYPLNKFRMVPATAFSEKLYKEDCGSWWEPSVEELADVMKYVYTHQDEARNKGQKAIEYIQKNWTWDMGIQTFLKAMDKYC